MCLNLFSVSNESKAVSRLSVRQARVSSLTPWVKYPGWGDFFFSVALVFDFVFGFWVCWGLKKLLSTEHQFFHLRKVLQNFWEFFFVVKEFFFSDHCSGRAAVFASPTQTVLVLALLMLSPLCSST